MADDTGVTVRLPKVVLVGNFGVGKSTLFKRLMARSVKAERDSAIVRLPDGTKVQLLDTCSMERFDQSLTGNYYRGASCVLLVADASDAKSIQSLQGWNVEAAAYAPNAVKILVMNKSDSHDADQIVLASVEERRKNLGCCFSVNLSAHDQSLSMLLDRIAEACRMLRDKEKRDTHRSLINLHQKPEGRRRKLRDKCC